MESGIAALAGLAGRTVVGLLGDAADHSTLTGPAAEVSVGQIAMALPYVVGKGVAPPARHAVEVSGEIGLASTVTAGDDGRATAIEACRATPR